MQLLRTEMPNPGLANVSNYFTVDLKIKGYSQEVKRGRWTFYLAAVETYASDHVVHGWNTNLVLMHMDDSKNVNSLSVILIIIG